LLVDRETGWIDGGDAWPRGWRDGEVAAAGQRDTEGTIGMARNDVTVRFWGVRGTLPCPGPDTVRYGGNTACVEVRCGEHLLILDAGSGLRALGDVLTRSGAPVTADLLLSHTHSDHICGLAAFRPCFQSRTRLHIWAGHLTPPGSIRDLVRTALSAPFQPDLVAHVRAQVDYTDFTAGDRLTLRPGIAVATAPLNHPGGATGYRIEAAGKVVTYVTDTEHRPGERDGKVLALAERADILIYDANYTDADFDAHRGWGHSTWQEAVRLARAASAKTLVLFHHDLRRDDAAMDVIASDAAAALPGTLTAREGLFLTA
jgi:phosphoribosyl 1,2-cyclic phosphodiesterase